MPLLKSCNTSDPTDRRQHPAVRLHHAGADRRGGDNPGWPRPRGRGDTPRLAHGPLSAAHALSEAQKRVYVLADNKLALNAGWDEDLLAAELGALLAQDLDLEVGIIGFSIPEVDALLATVAPEEPDDPADDVLPDAAPARVRRGEVWQLWAHRLICGDVRDPAVLATLMAGEQARLVFTDPPYNVPIDGHAGGLGHIKHREFAMAAGEMSREAFTGFLQQALAPLVAHSVEGSIHYVCMDWRHLPEILAAGEAVFTELKNLVVWVKDNGGMGTFYRSRHELILVFKHGTAPHCNTFELGQHGRYRTNVWQYPGVNTRRAGRMADLAQHPTVKPVQLIADALRDGIVKLRLTAVSDPQHDGFTAGSSPVSWGSIDELFVNLTVLVTVTRHGIIAAGAVLFAAW